MWFPFTVPVRPAGIYAITAGLTFLSFSWNEALEDTDFDSYRITYAIEDGPILDEIYVSSDVDEYTLEDLFPATEYTLYVSTSSGTDLLRTTSEPASVPASTCKYLQHRLELKVTWQLHCQISINL